MKLDFLDRNYDCAEVEEERKSRMIRLDDEPEFSVSLRSVEHLRIHTAIRE
ncbi:hypothetical protein WN48_01174 [Eufriesea mexicana]|nr:hypothetical protein WN48_01174 [Eufriesea mexicana]